MAISNDGLENVVAGLGTERDKMAYSIYGRSRRLFQPELDNMYRSSWLAKRIVNAIADDMTRAWRFFTFDSKDDKEQIAIEHEEKRLGVVAKVNQAIKWARLYGGGLLVLGTAESVQEMAKPLNVEGIKQGGLKWLQVLDRHRLTGGPDITKDFTSPNFGLPEFYVLADASTQIHHSRVLRFDGQKLPYLPFLENGYWHDSELQHVLSSLMNNDTASAAIATMLYEANVDVVTQEGLADVISTEEGEVKLIKRYQTAALLKSFNRMLLLDGTETFEKKSNNFANLDNIWTKFMIDVCGAADIPMVRLFGQSASGLNATGDNDIRNYYDMIAAKQEADIRPQLDYLDKLLVPSALGTLPDDYEFKFKSLWQMSDTEKATMQKTKADRDAIYFDRGVVSEGLLARELQEDGTYKNMTDEDVALAEELASAAPAETELQPDLQPKQMEI